MCDGFQEIAWHTTFFNSHAKKMEKSFRLRRKYVSHIYGYKSWPSSSKTKGVWFLKTSIKFHRRQRFQISNKFSSLKEVIAGVPQGSIDGSLLKLFINDLFLFICFSTTQMIIMYSIQ